MPVSGSLIELLTIENPRLDLRNQSKGAVTKNHRYLPLSSENIVDWPDFAYEHLSLAYGHLFDLGEIESDANPDLRGTPTNIEMESDVDQLGILWNYQICRQPLKAGAELTQTKLGLEACDVTMKSQGRDSKIRDHDGRPGLPDWGIYLNDGKRTVLVWGDSKCSSKWDSNQANLPGKLQGNWIWPYRQLLTYCVDQELRYGFILTPEELVAVRVVSDETAPESPYRLQVKSIPWENHGSGTLTVNLAIRALAMMSLNEGYRPILEWEDTLPLNVWWKNGQDGEGRETYEHHLSGHKTPECPPGADVRPRPDTIPGFNDRQESQEAGRSSKRHRRK